MTVTHSENFDSRAYRSVWVSLLVWLLALSPLIKIALTPERFQWDLRVLYSAAMTVESGYDPYDNAQRNAVFPVPGMEFFYPPLSLDVLRPLTGLPFGTVYLLWLGLKLSALVLLFVIWHRRFEPLNPRYPLVLFFLLAYSSTLYRDIAAGNIAIFEQLGLWLGFLFLVGRRYLLFGVCVALISQFKLQPIVFLGLLLLVEERPKWLEFGISLASFLALFSLNFLLQPALMSAFIARILAGGGNLQEIGAINPSLLALIREGSDFFSKFVFQLPPHVDILAYIVAVFGVLSISLYFFVTYRKKHPNYDLRMLVGVSCFVYSVTAARMKDYSYIILLLPTLMMLRRRKTELELIPVVAVLVLAPSVAIDVPFIANLSGTFYAYLPLLAATMMLWLHLDEFRKLSAADLSRVA
jgi:Glycosyltransferase family 87